MLKSFGVLPASEQARALTDRDYLLCALHLLLDEEERLGRLCPSCREAAQRCCPVCGIPLEDADGGGNASFDRERYEALKRGDWM